MSSIQTSLAKKRLNLRQINQIYRRGEKLTMLTAYDVVTASILDQAGIEFLLVGDSLGNVVLGYDTTIPVTLEEMIIHTQAVVRGSSRAFVIFDMPFGTYTDPDTALKNAVIAFQKTGCHAVKLEGGLSIVPIIKRLTESGIPVCAHIGLTPQSVHQMGGYFTHGKTESEIERISKEASAIENAGAFAIVLECLTPALAKQVTESVSIPTIGIGSGPDTSGQVLVINDLIGLSLNPPPSFAKPKANVAQIIKEAAEEYILEVKNSITSNKTPEKADHLI